MPEAGEAELKLIDSNLVPIDLGERGTMKFLGRLAALALPLLAATLVVAPASAGPASMTTDGTAGAVLAACVRPNPPTLYISNESEIGIGVLAQDGDWNYDAILAPHARTDEPPLCWRDAAGFYIGPGYCGELWRYVGRWEKYINLARGTYATYLIDGHVPSRYAVRYLHSC